MVITIVTSVGLYFSGGGGAIDISNSQSPMINDPDVLRNRIIPKAFHKVVKFFFVPPFFVKVTFSRMLTVLAVTFTFSILLMLNLFSNYAACLHFLYLFNPKNHRASNSIYTDV